MTKKSKQPEKPKTTRVAVLDDTGVYQGMQDIPLADLTPDHIHLPDGCDLPPGRYRWDSENKTFIPIPKGDR